MVKKSEKPEKSEERSGKAETADSDIRRCARLLETMARHERIPARRLEEALGYGAGTIHRLFSGKTELRLRHILLILGVLGVPPARFFRIAFPEDETARTEAEIAAQLLDLLDRMSPAKHPLPPAQEIGSEELDRRIEEALRRLGVTQPGRSPDQEP